MKPKPCTDTETDPVSGQLVLSAVVTAAPLRVSMVPTRDIDERTTASWVKAAVNVSFSEGPKFVIRMDDRRTCDADTFIRKAESAVHAVEPPHVALGADTGEYPFGSPKLHPTSDTSVVPVVGELVPITLDARIRSKEYARVTLRY